MPRITEMVRRGSDRPSYNLRIMTIVLALLIGVVAGLRAMTAPAAVSWAAALGWIDLSGTWLAFLGYRWTPWILTALALGELVTDQLPSTPSRTVPPQFGARILTGGLSGAAIGASSGSLIAGVLLIVYSKAMLKKLKDISYL